MKTDYSIRPLDKEDLARFPKLVRAEIEKLDVVEQNFFRENPDAVVKNPKIVIAIRNHYIVHRIVELRIQQVTWKEIGSKIADEFDVSVSESTLRRWAERAL
jgi:hypothetical protein